MMTMAELNRVLREYWEETKDAEPEHAAKEIMNHRIPVTDWDKTLLALLAHAYSNLLSRQGTAKPKRRHNPAINPRRDPAEVQVALDLRPYFVPSRKEYVRFMDMTAAYWQEWADARLAKADSLRANADWGRKNIEALRKHRKLTSGQLPVTVKEELFAELGATQDEEEEKT